MIPETILCPALLTFTLVLDRFLFFSICDSDIDTMILILGSDSKRPHMFVVFSCWFLFFRFSVPIPEYRSQFQIDSRIRFSIPNAWDLQRESVSKSTLSANSQLQEIGYNLLLVLISTFICFQNSKLYHVLTQSKL